MRIMMTVIALATLAGCVCTGQQNPTRMASNFINRESIITTTNESYPNKNPKTVALYTADKSPHTAYRIIGVAKVSKFNLLGAKRNEADMHHQIKALAASIGGDGLINLKDDHESLQANVIAYQKILI